MLQGKNNLGYLLERLLTAVLLTCLILSYQKCSPILKLSFVPNQTTSLDLRLQNHL